MVKLKKQKVRIRKRKVIFPRRSPIPFKTTVKFLILVLVLSVIGIGLVRLKYMFVDSDYFMIKRVDVKLYDEAGSLRELSLKEIGGKEITGMNIFFVDLKDLKGKIETAHPEFKDVIVRRFLPDKLIVETNLRKAIAQIRSDRYYPVDREGVLLPDVKNFPDSDLPIIVGIGMNLAKVQSYRFSDFKKERLDQALYLIGEMQTIDKLREHKLKVVDMTDPGNLTFSFEGTSVEIKIGNSDFRNRLMVLTTVLDQLGTDIDEFRYIDLRFEDPIIGPR